MSDTHLPEALTYEIRPAWSVLRDRTLRQVGYVVDLYGTDGATLQAGDRRSQEIFGRLSEIARGILPPEEGDCRVALGTFHPQLHYRVHGQRHGSVRLEMHVRHRHGLDQPVTADETRALRTLVERLDAMLKKRRDPGERPSQSEAALPPARR